ncbi:MAG TPA: DNA-3-methyladenine glycosylase [Candidatus Eisenbacteria bacterium]|nr:DNA-3-methyladenine glycosylase [Candidatus Eisenbacteria bacterium]
MPNPPARHRAVAPEPLSRSFYARSALTVARELLGCVLARRLPDGAVLRGRIVETEAYVGEEDKACHARAGRTARTDPLYGPPGLAYVYITYGMHYMLNAVAEPEGRPAAVLIRAAEPVEGIEWMVSARGSGAKTLTARAAAARHIAAGPARLTQAFGIDLRQNRADLRGPEVWIEPGSPVPDRQVGTSARIGCQTAPAPWDAIPWRFYVAGNPHVTPGTPRGAVTPSGNASKRRKTGGGARERH